MGHLSISESVCNSKLGNNSSDIAAPASPKANGVLKSEISDVKLRNGALKNGITNNTSSSTANGVNADANGMKLTTATAEENKKFLDFKPVDHTNLDEYTRNFKGDTVWGIHFKAPLKWDKVIQISLLHFVCLVCLLVYPLKQLNLNSVIFSFFMGGVAGFGITAGAHRFWTHRSYKANLPLRIILMACFSIAGQNTLYDWVRDHRVHHKYSESDADPHNANRGFFFAHVGWLMMLKHPEVLRRGRQIDMSDIINDPVVQFHQKYFIPLKMVLCFILPTIIPVYFFGESWTLAFIQQCIFRYVSSLNFTWSVNSAAHMWGTRPYDKRIQPSENIYVSILAMGEGWHNYHHVFPWDYKAAELGQYSVNFTTMVLDLFHKIGWAWDMKQPSKDLVRRTLEKYGDGSHEFAPHVEAETHGHCHYPEVPDPEYPELEDDAESSSTESSKLDENDNLKNKKNREVEFS